MKEQDFDLVVIGGGPGGYVAAIRASQLGMRTALVEKENLGGTCLNWGCIPTKALLRSADVLRLIGQAKTFGIETGPVTGDLRTMVKRSRDVAQQLQRGVTGLLKKNNVTVFKGLARIDGPGRVRVEGEEADSVLLAPHIILATGARPRSLPGLAVDGKRVWSYRDALVPQEVPRRLAIIGGGAIGVEFAGFYSAMGSQVCLIEMADRILPTEDEEVSALVAECMSKNGVVFETGCMIEKVDLNDTEVTLHLEGKKRSQISVDVVLVAAGIVGNIEHLGLEGTGVQVDRTHVVVDEFSRTGEPGVYAIGDLAGAPWLAHKAGHEAMICVEAIAGHQPRPLEPLNIPACIYTHPQVASVGYTESQARALGKNVKVGRFPFAANGKAIAMGATTGFVKLVFGEGDGELLGAHMVGEEVTEMIQGFTIARTLETTEVELIESVLPHPTLSEAMHEAALDAFQRVLHR